MWHLGHEKPAIIVRMRNFGIFDQIFVEKNVIFLRQGFSPPVALIG
jgi:hypothetical protein